MSTSDDEPVYRTQNPEQVDRDIYETLFKKYGQLDKKSFIDALSEEYSDEDQNLNEVRFSLYDLAKQKCVHFPPGQLVKRVHRGQNSKTVVGKYASDIYYLYSFIEGLISETVLQNEIMSKSRTRNEQSFICTPSKQQSTNENAGLSNDKFGLLFSQLSQINQKLTNEIETLNNKLSDMNDKYEQAINVKNHEIKCKSDELERAMCEIQRLRNVESKLKCENNLINDQLKERMQTQINHENEMKQINSNLQHVMKHMNAIEGKVDCMSTRAKLLYKEKTTKTHAARNADEIFEQNETYSNTLFHHKPSAENPNEASLSPTTSNTEDNLCDKSWASVVSSVSNFTQHDVPSPKTDTVLQQSRQQVCTPTIEPRSEKIQNSHITLQPQPQCIPVVCNNDSIFQGVIRKPRRKRIALYNVKAKESEEVLYAAICVYAAQRGVNISFITQRKLYKGKFPNYTLKVNMDSDSYDKMASDEYFWPEGVYWRDWVPASSLS